MTDARPRTSGLPSLTGMRFIAALLVFLYHSSDARFFADPGVAKAYKFALSNAGWVAVSFFFVLSGFVLTWSARPDRTLVDFWRRRALKIYPNHVVTGLLTAGLLLGAGLPVAYLLPNLLLLHGWYPNHELYLSVNPASWSLSSEMFFYLTFPALFFLIRKIPTARLWAWAAGLAAAVFVVPTLSYLLLPDAPTILTVPVSDVQWWTVYIFPVSRALEFCIGIVMARILREGQWVNLRALPAAGLFLAGYVISLFTPFLYGLAAMTIIPIALLIPAVAAGDLASRRSFLATRPMIFLGNISFAFYLMNALTLIFGRFALGMQNTWSTPVAIALILGAVVVTGVLAWVLYVAVERPATNLLNRKKPAPVSPQRAPVGAP